MAGEKLKYAEAVRLAMRDELESDPTVVIMGQEVAALGGVFTATQGLAADFKGRVIDTPLVESATVGWAIGCAAMGLKPIVEIMFMDFITTAMDQIVNGAAKLRYMSGGQISLPLVIRTAAGGGTGHGPQHSQHLESWFAHVPGLITGMPSTVHDAYWMLRHAVQDDNPVLLVESKYLYFREQGTIETDDHSRELYGARIVRTGTDVTIVAAGRMVQEALGAADEVALEGIDAEVVDLRYIWPWDKATVGLSLEKTTRLAIIHEAVRDFGWGGEIAAHAAEEWFYMLDAPVLRIGTARTPIPFSQSLEEAVTPDADFIAGKIRELSRH